ncbi:MAG: hypothetical protein JXB35_03815 [Anaerolineae bacterium]|nr:hypothetical protein [Anaerolineae bacterium]
MYEVGDMVFHPESGAGVITGIKKIPVMGNDRRYYRIKVLSKTKTTLLIPVKDADEIGLRPAIPPGHLSRVWEVLSGPPDDLPEKKKHRQKWVDERLTTGETVQIAKVVRDLVWRRKQTERLYAAEEKALKRGMRLLTGEVGTVLGVDLTTARSRIQEMLDQDPEIP